jgi:hypothetical protein
VTDQPRVTTTPDPDNAMFHIPEFTYWDTQVWACELGVPVRLLPGLRDAIDKHLSGHASERPEPSAATGAGWRALAFNAIGPVLRRNGQWLPLNVRAAVAEAVLDAIGTDGSRRREPSPACDDMLLTADEARELATDLGLQLHEAQDALAFVGECCDIIDREQRPVTTAMVREWLKGARCGRRLAAAGGVGPDLAATVDNAAPPICELPHQTIAEEDDCHRQQGAASDDGLRAQYAAAIVRGGGCVDLAAATDAVMAVRDRRMKQLAAEVERLGDWCRVVTARALDAEADRDRWHDELASNETDRVAAARRAETAEAKLAAIQRLADRYPVGIDAALLDAALDQPTGPDPAEDIDDWGDGTDTTTEG